MPTYPSGAVLPAGSANMLDGTDPNIRFTDATGTFKFRLLGGEMPWPGIQDGIICTEWPRNLSPGFKHLDLQAAQQDGVTWTATVYDPAEVILPLQAHGNTPQAISKVVSDWIAAWDPKNPGLLEYFTFDRGYWYCQARLSKIWQDQIKQSPRRHLRQKLTHALRIDSAFWQSIKSTSTFGFNYQTQTVTLTATTTLTYSGQTTGSISGSTTAATVQADLIALSNIGTGDVTVAGATGGPFTVTFPTSGTIGTSAALLTASHAKVSPITTGFVPLTNIGDQDGWPSYLCYGPGIFAFANGPGSSSMITLGTAASPILDNQVVLITTMPRLRSVVDLTPNLPTQALTGVQTFLEQLIDLISGVSGTLTVGETQASSGVPPLLQWFESLFGIKPPQGNLYALLNGRFTNPIPGVPQPFMASESYIPVSITNGNANSQIVASVTPQRRWPE